MYVPAVIAQLWQSLNKFYGSVLESLGILKKKFYESQKYCVSFGNAAISHSGLILLKTAYRKRGELLWAIGSLNFINLHSAAFIVFARYLVHAYKFLIIQKTAG